MFKLNQITNTYTLIKNNRVMNEDTLRLNPEPWMTRGSIDFIKSNNEQALIFEDDIIFSDNWYKEIDNIKKMIGEKKEMFQIGGLVINYIKRMFVFKFHYI